MTAQLFVGVDKNQLLATRLPRSLSAVETYGFGFAGQVTWITTVAFIYAALGQKAIFVWLPGVVVAVLLILQVQRLGKHWPEMSGGTPNYTARLLKNYPGLGRYAALGYFVGWVAAPAVNAVVLTELIAAILEPTGIVCPKVFLKVGFTCVAYIVAFSGTRALSILHLFFVVPAVVFLLLFCLQGLWWLTFSPTSPGLLPTSWSPLGFGDWMKWFFIAAYAVYGGETAASFVADSQRPDQPLRFLTLSASLFPLVFLGGSWVLIRLATQPELGENTFLNLLAAASPFWGQTAPFLVTLLLAFSCLLSSATSVANCPRILYQLALDGHLSPVFAVLSHRGVLEPALVLSFLLSLLSLICGSLARLLIVTGTSYVACFTIFHLALWLRRGRPEVRWPWLSLCFFVVEAVVLVVGGLAWSWQDLLLGLFAPITILAVDAAIRHVQFAPFHPQWWQRHHTRTNSKDKDFVAVQVIILILLVCSAITIGWEIGIKVGRVSGESNPNLLAVLLVTVAFVAVAIACWTSLPQLAAIAEAREHAENLFITALDTVPDTILVLDESGVICQANPAAEALFGVDIRHLLGDRLSERLPGFSLELSNWSSRSEQTLQRGSLRIVEVTLSERTNRALQEYIVILRDITQRKQAETQLHQALQLKDELAVTATAQAAKLEQTLHDLRQTQAQLIQTEKMSSLGQLVAGVAHEINNPVNFIYGNLTHVRDYTADLQSLIELYQQRCPSTDLEIQDRIADIDLDFLMEDLPKMISSMKVGAERIREIVLTLRNFSRLDEAETKPVNIHEGIDSTLLILQNRLKGTLEHSGIQIIKEYSNLPLVECYPGQLNQVFMNILNNAIDALHQHHEELSPAEIKHPSTITIRTEALNCDWVRISIKDNGPGMTDIVKSRLFDPFFTTKAVGEGTGLGLSISYQIVTDKHGGKLSCISGAEQGAEFWIEIPTRQSCDPSSRLRSE